MTTIAVPVAALDPDELERIDAYWRAANYLSVGQIYLLDNPLLRQSVSVATHKLARHTLWWKR